MNLILLLASIIFASWAWTLFSIVSSYNIARKLALPLIISPVSPLNPLWILTYKAFPLVLSLKYLPFGFGTWARCTFLGWTFHDKQALHHELGPCIIVVTPSGNEISVADPSATHNILSRRKEFIKPAVMYEQLNVFGRNLNTVEGEDWQRQRRLTAPNFNERTSSLVWKEALKQAHEMALSWIDQGAEGTKETVSDTATLALHVLTSVGFGLSYPFHHGVRNLPDGHSMTYRDALSLCLRNIITFAILPKKILSLSFLPKPLRDVGVAAREFQMYMEEMLSHERTMAGKREQGTGNLMGSLMRASEEAQKANNVNDSLHLGLTDEEIFGNIFAFNLAGHETTANAIAFSLVLLAAKPECQEWLTEEIQRVLGDSADPESWNYDESFPKLQRCLAVMYETLRLYGSIVFIPKSTGFHPQPLNLGDKTYVIPPHTFININVQALHTDPQTWGSDALEWRPNRWLKGSSSTKSSNKVTQPSPTSASETFISPDPGTFIPWADGPRECVGRKFSQVEFVAVLASLFHKYRVGPVLKGEGENEVEARQALMRMADESAITFITLQMLEPKSRALRWWKI